VLSGATPHQPPDAPRRPSSVYGEQKAAAEERLLALGRDLAIVRFAKVLTAADPMLRAWVDALRSGRVVHPFADIVNAPAPLDLVCALLGRIIDERVTGLVQLSGDRDLSYAAMASTLAASLGADPGLVRPIEARRPGSHFFAYPRFASLDSSRAASLLGTAPPSSEATVAAVCRALARGA
jgi:dTDP-4-dehydrorhamnose reductase